MDLPIPDVAHVNGGEVILQVLDHLLRGERLDRCGRVRARLRPAGLVARLFAPDGDVRHDLVVRGADVAVLPLPGRRSSRA